MIQPVQLDMNVSLDVRLNVASFRSKARGAKLWELSFQGTEICLRNCQIEVQQPYLATNNNLIWLQTTTSLIKSPDKVFQVEHICLSLKVVLY